jgi:2Fe-2S ferredoxin
MPLDVSFHSDDDADQRLLKLHVRLVDGAHFQPEAAAGYRIMELMRAYGLPIKAECGGAAWRDVPRPHPRGLAASAAAAVDEELARLDEIPDADDRSRRPASSMTDDLDGLEVELQPDSLIRRPTGSRVSQWQASPSSSRLATCRPWWSAPRARRRQARLCSNRSIALVAAAQRRTSRRC